MTMYICEICTKLLDDEEFPCVSHPYMPLKYCCEDCFITEEEEKLEAMIEDRVKGIKEEM